jgi:hypothetical protein
MVEVRLREKQSGAVSSRNDPGVFGVRDETRDSLLGRQALYQLSYFRN